MGVGRVGAGITETEVEGNEGSTVGDCSGEHVGVGAAGELLVSDGDVLVELESHLVGVSGRISCLASQEP